MTQTTLERTLELLEREISDTSASEKANAAQRLRKLFAPTRSTRSTVTYDEDDMFNNMPV